MARCYDCKRVNLSVTLRQSDDQLCDECSYKRFGHPVPRQSATSASKIVGAIKAIALSPFTALRSRVTKSPGLSETGSKSGSPESLYELMSSRQLQQQQRASQDNDDEGGSLHDYSYVSGQDVDGSNQTTLDQHQLQVHLPDNTGITVDDSEVIDPRTSTQVDKPSTSAQAVPPRQTGSTSGISASQKRKLRRGREKGVASSATAATQSQRAMRSSTKTSAADPGTPPKKQPPKAKKTNGKHTSAKATISLRCGLCMNWFESEETDAGFWVCQTCRLVPANINRLLNEVKSLRTDISSIQQTNRDLVQQLAAKVAQCDILRQENSRLKQGCGQSTTPSSAAATPQTSLLIGDSTIRDFDSGKLVDTKVVSLGGACVNDIKHKCLQSKEHYARVTIVVGTHDCASQDDAEPILNDYKFLLEAAKDRADSVTVSSVCPRTDDTEVQERVDIVNAELAVLCAEMDCEFVNNDNNFKTSDGSVNDCYLSADGLYLSRYGTNRLARNLKLPMTGNDVTKDVRQHRDTAGGHPLGDRPGKPTGGQRAGGQKGHQYKEQNNRRNNRLNNRQSNRQISRSDHCYNCGDDHSTDSCKLTFRLKCHYCGKLGHKAYRCHSH